MNDQIISADEIRASARQAFKANKGTADCPYPDGTEAANKWCTELHMLHLETDDDCIGC